MSETRAAGAIYDLGYQRYTGQRLGRSHALRTLFNFSLRSAFGLGRGSRAKMIPIIVVASVFLPALGQVWVANAASAPGMINYGFQLEFAAYLFALFAATQAPELLVVDKQQGVLPLYLSRPITGNDYVFSKIAAMIGALLIVVLGPQLVLFFGKLIISETPWTLFKDEYSKLMPIIGGSTLTGLLFGSIGLAISSLAARRAYASASVIGFFLLMPAASGLIRLVSTGDVRRYAVLANPVYLITGFSNWLFDIEAKRRSVLGRADLPPSSYMWTMLIASALCLGILMWRYRRADR